MMDLKSDEGSLKEKKVNVKSEKVRKVFSKSDRNREESRAWQAIDGFNNRGPAHGLQLGSISMKGRRTGNHEMRTGNLKFSVDSSLQVFKMTCFP